MELFNNQEGEWLHKKSATLIVKDEYQFFHSHAKEILSYHNDYLAKFKEALSSDITIQPIIRNKSKGKLGVKAKKLNDELRRLLETHFNSMKFEVQEKMGVYYYTSKDAKQIAGFDFALLNDAENLSRLHKLCFDDKIRYVDGEKRWNKFLKDNDELRELAEALKSRQPKATQNLPLILGEIQFGNWALAYRDLFKTLKANVQTNVDCLIYIVPAGNLQTKLSGGIVNFDLMESILTDFSKVVTVPVWVIGLDIEIH